MVCDNLDWWNLCSDDSNNVLSWFKHHHKNTTTQTPPHKHHHANTTTKTPPQNHHHKITNTTTPPQAPTQNHQHQNTPVPLHTTEYYFSTTPVLQSTTPYYKVLLHYYKVLFQYYKVYSSTTPYYKVLLQYANTTKYNTTTGFFLSNRTSLRPCSCQVAVRNDIRHTTPNTAPATQNDHPTSGRNLRKTAETSFPMRGRSETVPRPFRDRFRQSATRHATEVTFRAPDERFVLKNTTFRAPAIFPNFTKSCAYHAEWHLNFTKYCAYHENWHLNFTKYCACHTEWLAGLILVTYETSFPMRAETNVTLQTHQILRLPRKMTIQHLAEICGKQLKRHFQCAADPRPFRDRSETVPRPFPSVRNPPRNRGYFSRSGRTVCIEKYNISRSGYLSKFHQVLRLPRKVTLELHQVLRLPRKLTLDLHQVLRLPHRMTRRLDPRHIWNVISNARRNKCHPPNSPNTALATQNDHPTSGRNLRKTAETSFPMRGRSETVPRPFRDRSETVSVSPQPATQPRLLFALRTNGLYWKIQHFALRLSFQISPSPAPTTQSDTWTSPSTAPTTKSDTWPSPSTAPATQNDSRL